MAVGFPAKTDFATGDVLTATNMNDVTGTLNLLQSAQYAAGKNAIINGAMQIWQRGTSIAVGAATVFTTDRFQANRAGAVAGLTVSRQATNDTTNLPFIQHCARVQRDSGNTSTAANSFWQNFETINSIPFAGKTVTISFYARAGANFSATSSVLQYNLYSGTGTDQNVNTTGFTGSTQVITGNATLTTTWQRFTKTGTVAATATQLAVLMVNSNTGTAGANDYYEITGLQVEAASNASPFQTASGSIQGELALCQRYYVRMAAGNTSHFALGQAYSTTNGLGFLQFPVPMRTAPTALEQTGTAANYGLATSNLTFNDCTAVPIFNNATVYTTTFVFVSTGVVAGNATHLVSKNNNSYLGWSAEL